MMSLEARDVQTDEDFEDVVEDVLSLTTYMSDTEKKAVKRRISNKPPSSPRSPYLSSLSLTPRRSSLPPRGSLRGEVGEARRGALSSRHTWLNGQGSECDGAPENTKLKKHQPPRSASNGVPEHRDKEDMYDEILHLKKSLQTQKLDKEKMKARLQRLEEVKTKREKQIEELLDPTKGSEYTRSLVDSKSGGSTVVRGLKQQILRLEQQSREKEDTLTTLQSELRTTSMAEMKITMEIYYEEIQRLRVLLENAERSSRVESKGSQRQNRVLSSRVVCLSEKLQQLQQENLSLREELSTDTPVGGARGYREWSKQRLLRRLVEQEKRLEEGRRPTPSTRRSQSDQAIQTDLPITTTEGEVSRVTAPQEGEELVLLRGRILQLEKEKEELQERLTNREHLFSSQIQPKKENPEEPKERKEEEREEERWMEEQREGERRMEEEREEERGMEDPRDEEERGMEEQREGERRMEDLRDEEERGMEEKREEAARVLQRSWLRHREKDTVMLQSAMRAHLLRHTQLHTQSVQSEPSSDVISPVEEEMEVAMTLIQSVFRGHLARTGMETKSSTVPVPLPRRNFPTPSEDVQREEDPWPVSNSLSFRLKLTPAQLEVHHPPTAEVATTMDSDDSDDIIVSPSRPLRRREELLT